MSVPNFKKAIKNLSAHEQQLWKEKIFITSFCHYHDKGETFKSFLQTFTTSHRQEFLNYIVGHTLLGHERYKPHDAGMLQKMIAFMEEDNPESNYRHLAFRMQVAFAFKELVAIDTQCNQMTKEKVNAGDLWEWYEKLIVND